MDEIARLRARIDQIDQDILGLLKNRSENARQLGQLKQAKGRKLRDSKREKDVLRRVQTNARRLGLGPRQATRIFNQIVKMSVEEQAKPGPLGLARKNVLVVGGTGGMGRFFASFARSNGAIVRIAGRDSRKTRRIASELAVEPGKVKDAAVSDIVIVAVPMRVTERLALECASQMSPRTLLIDLASVKSGIADRVSAKVPGRIEYVSIHPLFGPQSDSLSGQTVAAVAYRRGPQWRTLAAAIRGSGGRIHFVTSDDHDKIMAMVQVLHHFALISLAEALEWNGDLSTSSIRATARNIQRLVTNWNTISDIQSLNPYARETRRMFAGTVRSMVDWNSRSRIVERMLYSHVQKWSRKL